jgi:di/tricarboxylate transporter
VSDELISLIVLIAVFALGTILPVHMGVLGFIAAFLVGTIVVEASTDDVIGGFPGDLFLILVGVTYLFAIAKNNGTVDWLVNAAVRAVGGRIAFIPWVMFLVTAALTAFGSVVPAAVAIIAPVGLGFAVKYRINPVLMGLLIINGASAGGFSPLSVFGSIVNGVVERENLPENEMLLFISSFVFNALLSIVVYLLFGGRELLKRGERIGPSPAIAGGATDDDTEATAEDQSLELNRDQALTLLAILAVAVCVVGFDLDVGMVSITAAGVLSLVSPQATKGAVAQVAWPTVLLICGIVTYVTLLEEIGTVDWLGENVADIGAPLIAGYLICLIGGGVSAFASTTGILGALIPLAVPILEEGAIGAVALIIALSISSSVVDSSPFSTSGALVVANSPDDRRDFVFGRLMRWGLSMVIVAPIVTWVVFLAPGW